MTKLKILGATAILASALASPAVAQQVPGSYRQASPDQAYQQQAYRQNGIWQSSYNRWDNSGGFRPGSFAAGTAAMAGVPPIGGEEYARRNGFVCIPGTTFRGEDGRRHPCQ